MEKFFSITSLITKEADGKLSVPSSIEYYITLIRTQNIQRVNRAALVSFDDESIHQKLHGRILIPNRTLLFGGKSKNDLLLSLWVDRRKDILPVAHIYQSTREIVYTNLYHAVPGLKKLTGEQLEYLFYHVFDHPEIIDFIDSTRQ